MMTSDAPLRKDAINARLKLGVIVSHAIPTMENKTPTNITLLSSLFATIDPTKRPAIMLAMLLTLLKSAISAPVAIDGLEGGAVAPVQLQIAPTPTMAIESTSAPQLAPTQPQVEQEKEELTSQEKIKLLEERLLRGEISEETYLNLKDKIEFEAKPFEPSPQLPPATGATGIEHEPPTQIQETDTSQPITEPPVETPQVTETPPESEATPMETPPEPTQQEPPMPSDLPPDAYQQPSVIPPIQQQPQPQI